MARSIMLQGTTAGVGKSLLGTALCRILSTRGKVAPFKSQDITLATWDTADGGRISRNQACQAEAAGITPRREMNPVLLEPTGYAASRVIFLGNHVATLRDQEYHWTYNSQALPIITESLHQLEQDFEILVLEGAGNPAEVNLRSRDIVNMRIAQLVGAPVLLVADIERGGAFASLIGTLDLMTARERSLVAGFIINKFCGDTDLLRPALDFLEQRTGLPVLGVIPLLSLPWLPGGGMQSPVRRKNGLLVLSPPPPLPDPAVREETYARLAQEVSLHLNMLSLWNIMAGKTGLNRAD